MFTFSVVIYRDKSNNNNKEKLCFFVHWPKSQMQLRQKTSFSSLEVEALCVFSRFVWEKEKPKPTESRQGMSVVCLLRCLWCTSAISHLIIHIEKEFLFVLFSSPQRASRPCPKKITRPCLWFIWKAVIGQLESHLKSFCGTWRSTSL